MTVKPQVLTSPNQQDVCIWKNQKAVRVHKSKYEGDFLLVGNDEWMKASRELKYSAFKLYMYIASNKDNYLFALSAAAVKSFIGIGKTSYHAAVNELIDKGYLIKYNGKNETDYDYYDFYTTPQDIVEDS